MPAENRSDGGKPRLDQILKDYQQAVDRGERPSPEDWIKRHADFAQPLREFFASRQSLSDQAIAFPPACDAPTLAQSSGAHSILAPASGGLPLQSSGLPRSFGDYQLESEIARGGMGVVYRARQVSLNRPVAVKMILAGELASPEDVARFRSEAEAAAYLDHPRIVPIYEIGEREGQHYFSMKFIDGESLSQRLHKQGGKKRTRAELEQRIQTLIDVARGIHYAHQRGIIHRDLKPANILIDSAGQPHITDFGLARRTSHDSQITSTGAIVGSPGYMAPEQALGKGTKSVTTAVDIYGLGAILYVALTGRPPFEGSSVFETILQVQEAMPVAPSKLSPEIDKELDIICLKCLEKDPESRYRSAGELADDLDRWRRGQPIHAMPPNAAWLFWRWISTHFQSIACVLIIGLVTGLLVCEPAINSLALNLGGSAVIYRGPFAGQEAPWVLKALEAYPRWIGPLAVPLMLFGYFSMGWFTDRLIKPSDLAGAILSGLGVGTVAAITAFLVGIGWQTIIEMAILPSLPDWSMVLPRSGHDAAFSTNPTTTVSYPGIDGDPVSTRDVMKKALTDMQARIPLGLWYGSLFSAGVLLLPATLQTVAAQYLRSRKDPWLWQIVHLLELSIPMSLMLVSIGRVCTVAPQIIGMLLLLLLAGWGGLHWVRPAQIVARRTVLAACAFLGACLLFAGKEAFFTSVGGGFNPAFAMAGAIVAALAVICRFGWWQRLLLYGIWMAVLLFSEGAMFGTRGLADPGTGAARQLAISASVSVILLGLAAVFSLTRQPTHESDSTA